MQNKSENVKVIELAKKVRAERLAHVELLKEYVNAIHETLGNGFALVGLYEDDRTTICEIEKVEEGEGEYIPATRWSIDYEDEVAALTAFVENRVEWQVADEEGEK